MVYYVYLRPQKQDVLISSEEINDNTHRLLLKNEGGNSRELYDACKVFCVGYIMGNSEKITIVNNIEEFR